MRWVLSSKHQGASERLYSSTYAEINHMRRYRYVPFDVGKPKVDPKRTKGTK